MKEDFLHYIWQSGQFELSDLQTTKGQKLTLLRKGRHNTLAGPDFKEALVKIDKNQWAGSVEIHIRSSDWIKHKHSGDPLYSNVILHVVWEEDIPIQREDGTYIPCLVLKHRVAASALNTYRRMMRAVDGVPCAFGVHTIQDITLRAWMDRLMLERLENRNIDFSILMEQFNGDIQQVLYVKLFRNFGFGANHNAFEAIATHLEYRILLKHKNDLQDIESLLFGMAGLLEYIEHPDTYTLDLYRRFSHWKKKYGLIPRSKNALHFFKLRPANFPTIRLAQLAHFFFQSQHLVRHLLQNTHEKEYLQLFDLHVSEYWQDHYHFGKPSKRSNTGKLSKSTLRLLLINTIAPFLYYYGVHLDKQQYIDRAIHILESLPPEHNHIVTQWKNLGLNPISALDTQALIHLKKQYCSGKKCMNCAVGQSLIKASYNTTEG